jgi:hypothetical protein
LNVDASMRHRAEVIGRQPFEVDAERPSARQIQRVHEILVAAAVERVSPAPVGARRTRHREAGHLLVRVTRIDERLGQQPAARDVIGAHRVVERIFAVVLDDVEPAPVGRDAVEREITEQLEPPSRL